MNLQKAFGKEYTESYHPRYKVSFDIQTRKITGERLMNIICILLLSVLFLTAAASYICYRAAFCFDRKLFLDDHNVMTGDQYEPFYDEMHDMIDKTLALPYEDVCITSFDGLRLHANLYLTDEKAPVRIMFHGYHGSPVRDFSGGIRLAVSEGCNVIAVHERAHGKSEGRCLTFGILERKDVLSWAQYAVKRFGPDTSVVLTGISMGASTVLMASDLELPSNIKGIIADCGYTSPCDIIEKVMRDLKLPPALLMPFVKLGARIFGRFDLCETSAPEALSKAKIPVLFIHGEDDRFVPCGMSIENHRACRSESVLFTVPHAAHGISFLLDHDGYVKAEKDFLEKTAKVRKKSTEKDNKELKTTTETTENR